MKKIISVSAALILAASAAFAQNLVILHVNDTHSHLEPVRETDEPGGKG